MKRSDLTNVRKLIKQCWLARVLRCVLNGRLRLQFLGVKAETRGGMAELRDEAKVARTPLLSVATAGGEGEGSYTSESKKFRQQIQSLLKPALEDTLSYTIFQH